MKFKYPALEAQYALIPEKLREICEVFDVWSSGQGITAVITRIKDPVKGESGVHRDYRAVDFRDQYSENKFLYSKEQVEEILDIINTLYKRDDKYNTLIHHSFKKGPLHFHAQISVKDVTVADRVRIQNGTKGYS